jgi:multidrug efflux pump subunit AcrB
MMLMGIFVLATYSIVTINRNAFPEVDLATILITTEYPGASPRDVEQNVTRLLEDELEGIAGIDKFTSVSSENVSAIRVNIDIDYPDQDEVKDEVRRAVDRVTDLPIEVEKRPDIKDLKSSELPVMVIGVSGDVDYSTIRQIAKIIERDLKNIKGVSKVEKYGYRDQEFQVDIDPHKLTEKYVALNDILYALEKRNVRSTGGTLESYQTQRNILTLSEFEDIEQVRNVIIRSAFTGEDLRIQDVADIDEGFEDEDLRTGFNGKRGISLVVKKSSNEDIIRLVKRLYDYIENKQAIMPSGVALVGVNDSSIIVRNRLKILTNNAVFGFFLVIAILIFFLSFRASFWIAMSIPTAFGISFILMPLFGVDINLISLAALIIMLGMLVDDSIVVSENIFYHRLRGMDSYKATVDGTMEVFKPVIATILTTMCAFAPMFAMTGVMGKFISVIPIVVIAALFGSVFDCFCILPTHLRHSTASLKSSEQDWRSRLFAKIAIPYKKTLNRVLKMRYLFIIGSVVLLLFSIWWGKNKVGANLFPSAGATTFYVYVELDEASTFDRTDEVVSQIEAILAELPKEEVDYYTSRIGTDQSDPLGEQTGGQEHLAYVQVTLAPYSKRDRPAEDIMEDIRRKTELIEDVKEIRLELEKPGPTAGTPIEFHVHSDKDIDRLYFVERMTDDLKKMKGVSDISSTHKVGREEYKLDLDYDALASVGLTVNDVAATLRIAFDGVDATAIVRDNEEIAIRVRFPEKFRQNIGNVLDLNIRNQDGKLIPIRVFAKLSTIRADSSIHHSDGDVTTTIYAQTDGISILPKTAIDRLIEKYTPELRQYQDVSFSYGGEAEETDESIRSLMIAFTGGIIAIYVILSLLFNSLSQPLLILAAVPFGFIGVVWIFYLHGRPFSFLALIGVVGLSGVVVNDSLIMVDFINKLVRAELKKGVNKTSELIEDVVYGASRRLRPVIITTATTAAGLIPIAYGIGGSDPFIEPMVLAMAWGLVFATILTLFLIPSLYLINLDLIFILKKVKCYVRKGNTEET